MDHLARTLHEAFPHLTLYEIKSRIIKACQDPIFAKIQVLNKLGASQEEVAEHVMSLLVTFMRLPDDAPQLSGDTML